MTLSVRVWKCVFAAGMLAASGSGVMAGPLAPPAGPIGSTYRTLGEVEPRIPVSAETTPGMAGEVYRIAQSGSYFLTGDIVVPSGKNGIVIAAAGVTLDMGGFTIRGEAGSLSGIADVDGARQSHIFNGHFDGLGEHGLWGNFAQNSIYRNLTAINCGQKGMQLASGSVAEHCTARNCSEGIGTGHGVTLRNCSASSNTFGGFALNEGSVAEGCTALSNAGVGIRVSTRSRVTNCTARGNTGDGFTANTSSILEDCLSVGNGGNGFLINAGGSPDANSVIRRCSAFQNSGAGIRAGGGRALIDENVCRQNGTGILVQSAVGVPSLVIRNLCGGNTSVNYNISANHRVGTIVQGALSGAINGNTGGGLGTSDPWANFVD